MDKQLAPNVVDIRAAHPCVGFNVIWGMKQKTLPNLQDAVNFAKEKAMNHKYPVTIFNNTNQTYVVVVTDDANGPMIQRLSAFPSNVTLTNG
jgi:hypothetical protein